MLKYPNSSILQTVCHSIDELLTEKSAPVIAIDGNCASGKSTLAAELARLYDGQVISMDDFFLPLDKRTAERLAEPGGNVDRERFTAEVLAPLLSGQDFAYQPYDCHSQSLKTAVNAFADKLTIIEGAYSCQPYFGSVYDLRICLTIDPELQLKRLAERNPAALPAFIECWIPLENAYLQACDIAANCDLVFDAGTDKLINEK